MANGETLISCGFTGFWACFDLLITNQLLYQLSHTSMTILPTQNVSFTIIQNYIPFVKSHFKK